MSLRLADGLLIGRGVQCSPTEIRWQDVVLCVFTI